MSKIAWIAILFVIGTFPAAAVDEQRRSTLPPPTTEAQSPISHPESPVPPAHPQHRSEVQVAEHHDAAERDAVPTDHHEAADRDAPQADHHETEEAVGLIPALGRFHPLAVHFPIALLISTLLAETLYTRNPRESFDHAAGIMLTLAAASAVASAMLGYAFSMGHSHTGIEGRLFWWHRLAGTMTAILSVIAWRLRPAQRSPQRAAYMIALTLATISVSAAGYLGASLIYGPGHLRLW